MRILVFDTETTGLPPKNTSVTDSLAWPFVVQWSWLVYDTNEKRIVTTSDYIIKLTGNEKIPAESTAIHGITNDMMRTKGRLFKQVLTEFISDYEMCDYLVAHNLEFDKKMIQVECFRHHLPVSYAWGRRKVKEYCTMKRTRTYCGIKATNRRDEPYIRYPKLSELHDVLLDSHQLKSLHDSMVDVIVCFRCFVIYHFEYDPFSSSSVVYSLFNEIKNIYGVPYARMLKKLV